MAKHVVVNIKSEQARAERSESGARTVGYGKPRTFSDTARCEVWRKEGSDAVRPADRLLFMSILAPLFPSL